MKSSLFLTCLCIVFLAIPQVSEAQRVSKKVPIIQEDDTVRVYSAFSLQFLQSERLANQKSIVLTKAEIKQFNQLFESTKQSHRQPYSPPTREGLFIEVRPREGKKHGYYISPKKICTYKYNGLWFRWIQDSQKETSTNQTTVRALPATITGYPEVHATQLPTGESDSNPTQQMYIQLYEENGYTLFPYPCGFFDHSLHTIQSLQK